MSRMLNVKHQSIEMTTQPSKLARLVLLIKPKLIEFF
jgi:hypothetical protein